jgi:hypothetical protein
LLRQQVMSFLRGSFQSEYYRFAHPYTTKHYFHPTINTAAFSCG